MLQCIGQRKERNKLIRCENIGAANDLRWPAIHLCALCANSRHANNSMSEEVGVHAMQSDREEYRDQIAAGFAAGAQRSYGGGDE